MRRSTTFAGTERLLVGLALVAELVVALVLLRQPGDAHRDTVAPAAPASNPPVASSSAPSGPLPMPGGRTADVLVLGGRGGAGLAGRIEAELPGAVDAVTAFWGDDWPRRIVVALTGTDEEFRAIGGGGFGVGSDVAATTTAERIAFAPEAAAMGPGALRIVVRHELFHYAARAQTAADAPRWLTEGVADFVGRPATGRPGPKQAALYAVLPTDVDLDTPGPVRSLAYDRAWWFSRFVADRYGKDALRRLYVAACGPGHGDVDGAVRSVLGADTADVLASWRGWMAG